MYKGKVFGAHASAFFHAILRGAERGALGFAILFGSLFLGTVAIAAATPNVWTHLGSGIFLLGLVVSFVVWIRSLGSQETELPPTTVSISDQGVLVSAPMRNPIELIAELRTQIQGRKNLPTPYGSVDSSNDSADSWRVRKYGEEERKKVIVELEKRVAAHDQRILSQLAKIEKHLTQAPKNEELPELLEQAHELKDPPERLID